MAAISAGLGVALGLIGAKRERASSVLEELIDVELGTPSPVRGLASIGTKISGRGAEAIRRLVPDRRQDSLRPCRGRFYDDEWVKTTS